MDNKKNIWFSNDNLSSNTNPRFLEEWEGEIIVFYTSKLRNSNISPELVIRYGR